MEGAALFGLNPNKIVQRKARYTIGIDFIELWDEELHSKNGKKFYSEEKSVWVCLNSFLLFIKVNQTIELGQEIIKKVDFNHPRYCEMDFYKTLKTNPIFFDEKGIEKIGKLRLDAGKDYPLDERNCIITMRIGGTFIDVKAKHLKSGKTIKTKLDFI